MLGYFNQPFETSQILQDGWLNTGDLFEKRGENLYFLGRKKRLINRGGEKIHPSEIENILHRFIGVEDAYVVEEEGRISAYLQAKGPIDPKRVAAFLRTYLPSSHLPDTIQCVPSLSGKMQKK